MESTCPSSSKQDLISQLPSDVLVPILENLDLRDAVRVGVLSRRWRCLPAQLPRLDLDIDSFLPDDAYDMDDPDDGVHNVATAARLDVDGDPDFLFEAGDKMAEVATALLASRKPTSAATLTMRFYLRHNYMSLGRLLDDAVASVMVHTAELTITTTAIRSYLHVDCQGTEHRLVGYGRRFKTLLDACPLAFGALTQLTIENMRYGGCQLGKILTTCTKLEKLCLYCCGPGPSPDPRLVGLWHLRHACLKEINIFLCFIGRIKLAWLPRLERFTLWRWFLTKYQLVSFGHVPRLTTFTLSGDIVQCDEQTLKLSHILANNTALTDLRLNFCGHNIWVQPETTSTRLIDAFSNLKNLKIRNVHRECALNWILFLVQSAPHLEMTEHNCGGFPSKMKNVPWEVASGFKHFNLARVKIVGFYSTEETIIAFIRHLIEAAVNLDEICMPENAPSFCKCCEGPDPEARSRFPQTYKERDAFRKRVNDGSTATVKIHI